MLWVDLELRRSLTNEGAVSLFLHGERNVLEAGLSFGSGHPPRNMQDSARPVQGYLP